MRADHGNLHPRRQRKLNSERYDFQRGLNDQEIHYGIRVTHAEKLCFHMDPLLSTLTRKPANSQLISERSFFWAVCFTRDPGHVYLLAFFVSHLRLPVVVEDLTASLVH